MNVEPDLALLDGRAMGKANGGPGSAAVPGATPAPSFSVLDRGLHFGDGLFETLACRQGRARFLGLHLERLSLGCQRLKLNVHDFRLIRSEIEQAAQGRSDSLIKLIVTRGPATSRGYAPSGQESATRVLLRYPWPQEDPALQTTGVRVRVAATRLGESPSLAGMKHLNRLEQVLARSEVPASEAADLLLFSSSGRLISGTMSNVFIVRGGKVVTPRIDLCGVAGVMRRVVLREAAQAGMEAEEGVLSEADLNAADEVFLTNARIGIWPVQAIGSRTLAAGNVTRKLQALISPMLEMPVDA